MLAFNNSQLKLLSNFFSNIAVVWFTAAFVGALNLPLTLRSIGNGIMALLVGLYLLRESK